MAYIINKSSGKKKGHFLYIGGSAIVINTGTNLLDTKGVFTL